MIKDNIGIDGNTDGHENLSQQLEAAKVSVEAKVTEAWKSI